MSAEESAKRLVEGLVSRLRSELLLPVLEKDASGVKQRIESFFTDTGYGEQRMRELVSLPVDDLQDICEYHVLQLNIERPGGWVWGYREPTVNGLDIELDVKRPYLSSHYSSSGEDPLTLRIPWPIPIYTKRNHSFSYLPGASELMDRIVYVAINGVGPSGQTLGHIAIFQNDSPVLEILLGSGLHPHALNSKQYNLVHVAAQLGRLQHLEMLYATGYCDLRLKTADGMNALALTQLPFTDSDLVDVLQFSSWHVDEVFHSSSADSLSDPLPSGQQLREQQLKHIESSRMDCYEFLHRHIAEDEVAHIKSITTSITKWNRLTTHQAEILHGTRNDMSFRDVAPDRLHFPMTTDGRHLIDENEKDLFEKLHVGVHITARSTFVDQAVRNAFRIGSTNAEHHILEQSRPPVTGTG